MAVCLTGGEPLLVGNHLFEVLKIYRDAGCYTSINSNGRLITSVIAERLAQAELRTALISIHGLDDLHDLMVGDTAFKETWRGIQNLRDQGIAVTPNFVATAKNVHGLMEIGLRLLQSGIASMAVTPFLPSWGAKGHEQFVLESQHYRDYFAVIKRLQQEGMQIDSTLPIPPCVLMKHCPESWERYLSVLSPRVCMAGRSFGVVSPDGLFRACIQAPYLEFFGGSVFDQYEQSWKQANVWAESKMLLDDCLACAALTICGGGCRTSSLWENKGSVAGKTMYMGEPLTEREAKPFIDRTVVPSPRLSPIYQWNSEVRLRDEGWGMIVFNPCNQSFTILSSEFGKMRFDHDQPLKIASDKIASVLLAIGAVRRVDEDLDDVQLLDDSVIVLPGDHFLPRLTKGLDPSLVHCLRADTGERYFF
ncbi:MAG: Radical SAM domain protein [Candidatus Uhrbacteria bacterium GW2011_GWF2_40_263]|nr:MAG: Radical SAM domain protein [Candidatus Uhrbacteria bacterium GW2011_GWF2_40_263]